MYGLPTHEAFVDAEEGKIVLGGCVISNESPRWHCPNCGRDHGELAKRVIAEHHLQAGLSGAFAPSGDTLAANLGVGECFDDRVGR